MSQLITREPPVAATERVREIEVLIISAQGLKNVKHVSKMRAYAAVYVEKDDVSKTRVDEVGGTEPEWNEVVRVRFREGLVESDVLAAVNVDIYAHGHVREKPVGSARVLLSDVLRPADHNPIQCVTLQVWRPSGRPHGLLNLRFLMRRDSLSFTVKEVLTTVEGGEGGK